VQGFQIKPKPGDATFRVYLKLVWHVDTTPTLESWHILLNLKNFDCCLLYLSRYYMHFATHRFWQKFEHFSFKIYIILVFIITIPCTIADSRNLLASTNITLLLVAYSQHRDSYSCIILKHRWYKKISTQNYINYRFWQFNFSSKTLPCLIAKKIRPQSQLI